VLANAWEAIELFSAAGVDLILSGHLHQAFLANSDEFYPRGGPPVVILHSGTTTSSRGRGRERERNSCNWIGIDEREITISMLRWEPAADDFLEQSRHLYPRQERRPYALAAPRVSPPAPWKIESEARNG